MKKIVIFVVILLALGVMVTQVPIRDGKALIESAPAQKLLGKGRELAEPASRLVDKVEKQVSPPATVYRWREADGSWHFGNRPPDGVAAEPVEVPEVNTLSKEQVINSGI